jgi:hypothetical protein
VVHTSIVSPLVNDVPHIAVPSALRSGGIVIDFPGGAYDVYRPTRAQNVIDFHGRTGYEGDHLVWSP